MGAVLLEPRMVDAHCPVGVKTGACPRVAEHSSGFPCLSHVLNEKKGTRLVLMQVAATHEIDFANVCFRV